MDGATPPEGAPKERSSPAVARPVRRRVNLALQGGGTHGAFTWGALDRLLEEEDLDFDGLSGTSAGAINGAIFALGLLEDGRAGAKAALERFWRALGSKFAVSPFRSTPVEKALWGWDLSYNIGWNAFETVTRMLSPYQINPFPMEFNPLRKALDESLDLARLRGDKNAIRLFISATNVRTGKPKVFTRPEITVDALLASACLPNVFRAVEIDGEAYWDGGYLGNPALWPLYHDRLASDIVLVQLNPLLRPELPTTTGDIMNRLNEISFNASLMSEMRAIDFVQRMLDAGRLEQPRYRRLFLHIIEDETRMRAFKLSTKFNGDWDFLQTLRDYGREAADRFLRERGGRIGKESTLDIQRYL
ncbi:patatin-like phospholipase family protein [Roseococcus sp. DSY-14]|uniref:patatin-like phospholipase family protein n=1 Tax=Roseococcus sp. DSY-14 TaxID=3369650 RepID=UPI00387A8710